MILYQHLFELIPRPLLRLSVTLLQRPKSLNEPRSCEGRPPRHRVLQRHYSDEERALTLEAQKLPRDPKTRRPGRRCQLDDLRCYVLRMELRQQASII